MNSSPGRGLKVGMSPEVQDPRSSEWSWRDLRVLEQVSEEVA